MLTAVYFINASSSSFILLLLTPDRYIKDISYYKKELQGQQSKLALLQASPDTCPHVLKKHLEGVKETEAMIPDCQERLKKACDDLREFLMENSGLAAAEDAKALLLASI